MSRGLAVGRRELVRPTIEIGFHRPALPRSKKVDRAFGVFRIAGDGVDAVSGDAHLARGPSFPTCGNRPGNAGGLGGCAAQSAGQHRVPAGSTGGCWGGGLFRDGRVRPCLHAVRPRK